MLHVPPGLRLFLSAFGIWCCAACERGSEAETAIPFGRYVDELRRDVQQGKGMYNPAVACYVDLTYPDNSYRFFVLDLARRKVLIRGVCLNGLTDEQGRVRYSNEVNSNCSSRGLASIGERYVGSFGRAFRLYGLEASTRNLRRRAVVLHSWAGVPARPTAEHPIQSEGCPTLNPLVLDTVAAIIARSPKPILLRFN
jgi:hypothetical protein